jgi:hypothetical protein
MATFRLAAFSPDDVTNPKDGAIRKWNDYPVKFLAQGDSWFSLGALPTWNTSSILLEMSFGIEASVVNCAQPGQHLTTMIDWRRATDFAHLLAGRFAYKWDGIMLSGGGNDLIAAASTLPCHSDGSPIDPAHRLLLKPDEWGPASLGPARYLSDDGWATFVIHLSAQLKNVVAGRDKDPLNRNTPMFCHTYDYPQPRDAPVLPHTSTWLYPAFVAYGVPPADWLGTAKVLIDRLAALLRDTIGDINAGGDKRVYLVDSRGAMIPADPGTTERSNDWINEIHPTSGGYRKLAARWRPVVDAQFGA